MYEQLLEDVLDPNLFQSKGEDEIVQDLIRGLNLTENPDGTYSAEGDVNLSDMSLKKLPLRFKYVGGGFSCSHNQLTSLQGVPQEVGKSFSCYDNHYNYCFC